MKQKFVIISIALVLLIIGSCAESDSQPLLMCDFADERESVTVDAILHEQDGDHSCTICTDEYGMLSYSPSFAGEFAEVEFVHNNRDYGAILQKGKHVKMVIAHGEPIFSCDNKECNDACEAIRRIYEKEQFLHTDASPASYDEKTKIHRQSIQKARQYIAVVADNDLRERLTKRVERIHNEYAVAIDILKNKGDREEYNSSINRISLYDENIYLPSLTVNDFYTLSN